MNRFSFALKRILDPQALMIFSVSQANLLTALNGKSVAIVGNARSLEATQNGAKIDSADIIIRINRAPMPSPISHGTKTDWLALATSLPRTEYNRIKPTRILWMSHKRKRLSYQIAQTDGFYLHPNTDWRSLHDQLGGPPSTGAMIIDLAHRSKATSIDLYGFDFFATKSLSGSRDATQVPHDFPAEKTFVHSLMKQDNRITIHN